MSAFNRYQQQALQCGCAELDRRITELERLISRGRTDSSFSVLDDDLPPQERQSCLDCLVLIRRVMQAWLQQHDVPLSAQRASLRWLLKVGLGSLQVQVGEMGPRKLSAYGRLSESGRAAVEQLQQELNELLTQAVQSLTPHGHGP